MGDERWAGTRTAYDVVARSYAELIPDVAYEARLELALVETFVAGLGPGAAVLDAGCGTGRMLGHLLGLGPTLVLSGVDLSPGMLAVAREAQPTLDLREGRLDALPMDDEQVDGVLAWYSLIHTPTAELAAPLSECFRVLRPGGALLLGYQAGTGPRDIDRPYGHDVPLRAYLHDTPSVIDALEAAGFTITVRLGPRRPPRRTLAPGLHPRPAELTNTLRFFRVQ